MHALFINIKMGTDNNTAGSWGRLRFITSLKSIGGISLFLLWAQLRNVHITSIESSDQILSNAAKKAPSTSIKPVEKIVLLGERHSGTNWITDHLRACFQSDDIKVCCDVKYVQLRQFHNSCHIDHRLTYFLHCICILHRR